MDIRTGDRDTAPRGSAPEALPGLFEAGGWAFAAQVAICGIFLIVFVAALDLARPVLLPVTFAFVVGWMLGPLQVRADRSGVPMLLTAISLWLLVIVVCNGLVMLLSAPVIDWVDKAPEIGRLLKERLYFLNGPWVALQDIRNAILPEDQAKSAGLDLITIVQPVLSVATPALGQVLIFFATLFFVLLGRSGLRRALVVRFDDHESRLRTLRIWNDIEHQLTSYLSVVAIINLIVGLGAAIIAFSVGLPNALAWGVLAFILNFIPYLGAVIMELILLGVGLVTFPTLTHALAAPLLYLVFTTLEGHFITPSIMGRRLTLSPLIVFLALVFWTWLWGPAGAFLAVPLLIVGLVAIHHIFPKHEPNLPG
ncbi:AI-2E family transporter [Pseudolabrys sp. FHR47]|uniref:AI-2E family transporter n=1 Tax=Pseudolabrys sp. FHR47 TaxID=2562284 RepID=UPI00143DC15D|nr:AI-2E family transporter [Pseudolabrys sp. FHR47]